MANNIEFEVKDNLSQGVHKFINMTGSISKKGSLIYNAWIAVGLGLLNFCANGSPANSTVPPKKTGLLRGSGSVFIGSDFITSLPKVNGQGTPNTSHSGKTGEIVVGYNTAYAARLHENLTPRGSYQLGEGSLRSGDVQGGWLRSHLQSDGKLLMQLFANIMKKEIDSQGKTFAAGGSGSWSAGSGGVSR